jgi:CRP-like cAMP-binding protein
VTSLADRLRSADVFADLTEERLAWLAELGEVAELRAGTVVARQGDPADAFWLILDGRVRWTRRVGGREVHAVTLGPGEVFAELILILGASYPTTGTAIEATTLVRFAPDAFWAILGTCPGVLAKVTRIAVQRAEIHETVASSRRGSSASARSLGPRPRARQPHRGARRAAASLEGAVEVLAGPAPAPAADEAARSARARRPGEELRERLAPRARRRRRAGRGPGRRRASTPATPTTSGRVAAHAQCMRSLRRSAPRPAGSAPS